MGDLKPTLAKIADGAILSEADAEAAFDVLMSGAASPAQIGGFLMALRVRGEHVNEITAAARVMRAKALKVEAPADCIDVCGTGGDGMSTFNISTAVALVVAACGVTVAKHGNRAMSSKSGGADVLVELGVNIDVSPQVVARALHEARIGFIFAQKHHNAMKYVGPVRQELGQRTIFNLLGPLANPAGAKRQVVGVFARKWVAPMAETLGRLGSTRAWVVHGSDGLDEITSTGVTYVTELKDGALRAFEVVPEDAGLKRSKPEDLIGGDAKTNGAALRTLLHGRGGAYRDIVVLNAAAALVVADKAPDLKEGAAIALDAIMSGKANKTLAALVAITQNTPAPV